MFSSTLRVFLLYIQEGPSQKVLATRCECSAEGDYIGIVFESKLKLITLKVALASNGNILFRF
jgi:hypothetical protein